MPSAAVLVVDDDETLRFLARRQLKHLGFECDFAIDGQEAVAKADANRYKLILMDVQMPEMDGLEATVKIRSNEAAKNIEYTPIVAVTAMADKQRCYDAGMNDFMFKPVAIDELRKMLTRWVS